MTPTIVLGDTGHTVIIADHHATQARCTCGWHGPDRTDDPHALPLVVDDTGQHLHAVGLPCPDHPPGWPCKTCVEAGR